MTDVGSKFIQKVRYGAGAKSNLPSKYLKRNSLSSVFISYKQSSDREIAFRVQEQLIELGYQVFRDETSIKNGVYIKKEISRKIRKSKFFLLCHSREALQSQWVQWELGVASAQEDKGELQILVYNLDSSNLSSIVAGRRYDDLNPELKDYELKELLGKTFPELNSSRGYWVSRVKWSSLLLLFFFLIQFTIKYTKQSDEYNVHLASWTPIENTYSPNIPSSIQTNVIGYNLQDSSLFLHLEILCIGSKKKFFLSRESKLFTFNREMALTGMVVMEKDVLDMDIEEIQKIDLTPYTSTLLGKDLFNMKTQVILYFQCDQEITAFEIARLSLIHQSQASRFGNENYAVDVEFSRKTSEIWH